MLARGKAPPPSINMKKVSMLSCVALGAVLLTTYVLWISPLQQELDDANYEVISLREELAVLGRTSKAAEERSHREQRQLESQVVDLEAHVEHLQSMVDQQEAVNRNQQQLCHENAEALEDSVSGLTKLVTEQSDMLDECEFDLREALDSAELLKSSANQCQQGMQEAIADWEVWQMERVALERERYELKEAVGLLERELEAAWTSAQDVCGSGTLLDEVDDGGGGGTSDGKPLSSHAEGGALEHDLSGYSWALPGGDGTANAENEAGDGEGALRYSDDGGVGDSDAQEHAQGSDGEEDYFRTESGVTEHGEAEYDESQSAEYAGEEDVEWQKDGADDAEYDFEYDEADQSAGYNEQASTAYSEIDDGAYLSASVYVASEAEYNFGDEGEVEQSGAPLYEYDAEGGQYDAEDGQYDAESDQHDAESDQYQYDAESDQYDAESDQYDAESDQYDAESDQYDAESDQYDAESDQYDAESEQYDAESEQYDAESEQYDLGSEQYDAGSKQYFKERPDEAAKAWQFEDEEEDWLERTKRVAQQETDETHKAQLLSAAEYAKKFGSHAGGGGGEGGAEGERKPDAHWHPKAEEKKRAMEEAFQMMAEKHGNAGPPRAHGIGDGLDPLGNRVRQGDSPHFMFQ